MAVTCKKIAKEDTESGKTVVFVLVKGLTTLVVVRSMFKNGINWEQASPFKPGVFFKYLVSV